MAPYHGSDLTPVKLAPTLGRILDSIIPYSKIQKYFAIFSPKPLHICPTHLLSSAAPPHPIISSLVPTS